LVPPQAPPLWLDPRKAPGSPQHPDPPNELPPDVRAFGYIPSLENLLPGDVLLVCAVKPGWVSKAIQRVQEKAGHTASDSRWHHAAVYLGDATLCEAVGGGVRISSVYDYSDGNHLLCFRRDPKLTEIERYRVALNAALKLKYGYSRRSIVRLYWKSFRGWNKRDSAPRILGERTTICSQLYADALGVVTKRTFDSNATTGVAPVHLFEAKQLDTVPMTWFSVPKSERQPDPVDTQDADWPDEEDIPIPGDFQPSRPWK
jgi:hypothetical protein